MDARTPSGSGSRSQLWPRRRPRRGPGGTDSLEHATDMDDATVAEMARRKTWYVPTIDHNRYYADNYKLLGYPATSVEGLNDSYPADLATAQKAWKAGVRFAMGSDAVYTMYGENTRELGWFVKVGMTPDRRSRQRRSTARRCWDRRSRLRALVPATSPM